MTRFRPFAFMLLCLWAVDGRAGPPTEYPGKAVTLVVPFPAGGSTDAAARAISAPLANALGQPVIVDNVSGGSGSIGAAKVARSKADGYTVLLGTVNETVLAPLVNRSLSYKSEDLVPAGKVGQSSFVLVGRQGIPAQNIDELIDYARKNPGRLSYATSGVGTVQHVTMARIQELSGTSLLHVPYRGGSTLVADLLGGQVDLALVSPATFPEYLENGRVQVFGTVGIKRDELLKRIPTVNEGKYLRGLDQDGWLGIFLPASTPPDITRRLSVAIGSLLSAPELVAHLKRINITPGTAAEQPTFAGVVSETRSQMRAIVSRMNLDKDEAPR